MKRNKTQKGITLVALIITIIVLLILAVVAIRAVQGDGIIAHAKNARAQYEEKAAEENAMLSNLTDYIAGQIDNNGENNIIKQISFTVKGKTYYAEENMTWKEWEISSYYVSNFRIKLDFVYYDENERLNLQLGNELVLAEHTIVDGAEYTLSENHSGGAI